VGLETILLSEISQFHKDKYCVISVICGSEGETPQGHVTKRRTAGEDEGEGKKESG
jgi:hypothetical protein